MHRNLLNPSIDLMVFFFFDVVVPHTLPIRISIFMTSVLEYYFSALKSQRMVKLDSMSLL